MKHYEYKNLPSDLRFSLRKQSLLPVLICTFALSYILYVGYIFEITKLFREAKIERGALLASDMFSYKTHTTLNFKKDSLTIAVEGERGSTYKLDNYPEWFIGDKDKFEIVLRNGFKIRYEKSVLYYFVPNYGEIEISKNNDQIFVDLPNKNLLPEGIRFSELKFDARPHFEHRIQYSRSKIEIHYYEFGWENFWFPMHSPFNNLSFVNLWELILSSDRIKADESNFITIFNEFWNHPDWQHGDLAVAVLETILMAFLGTLVATLVGLPLAFAAAQNINPSKLTRFGIKRFFDFVRGLDYLIWSLIFIRSFGLGPLTGALAIAFTDTGTLGKLFTEALENVEKKEREGVQATGATPVQQFRFGIIPQISPILVSQILYYFESNTRSATVIGALGAGGIGLMLVQTMRTRRDWENSLYIIIVALILVFLIDNLSSRLRKKLIRG